MKKFISANIAFYEKHELQYDSTSIDKNKKTKDLRSTFMCPASINTFPKFMNPPIESLQEEGIDQKRVFCY